MILECNLVKISSIDTKIGRLVSRERIEVESDTEVMDAIAKFIVKNSADLIAAIPDKRLTSQLTGIESLTIMDFNCLRYLCTRSGFDFWMGVISDTDKGVNDVDIPENVFEYNVFDSDNIHGLFLPHITKISQVKGDNKLTALYERVIDIYGLYESRLFEGIINPFKPILESMKSSEEVLGTVPSSMATYMNSVMDFLNKDIRVFSN